ncbi:MAG TPA: response regulator [Methanocorpusculum sp.]|nr:response regulator [Methanocorpusculum sp.]
MTETLLVIDDDAVNRVLCKNLLKNDYVVTVASSAREGYEVLNCVKINLILLDIRMPETDGFACIKELKANPSWCDIPVIFLTGETDNETEIRGFQTGAADFIRKPFVKDLMLQRIKRTLEYYRLQKNLEDEVIRQTRLSEERYEKIDRMSREILKTLARAIDAKDPYTNGHSRRVASYSADIAERMKKTPDEVEKIYYIALMHDIGKIGVPDTLINKTTVLTGEDSSVVREHTVIGARILSEMKEIPGIDVGAHWHHEKWDGTGYPDGLKGTEIPEIARIIAVADAYDAMTSNRSYRRYLPQDVARTEIEAGSGTQFDPQIADTMLEMIDEDKEYRMHEEEPVSKPETKNGIPA